MNKKKLVKEISELLKENSIKKPIRQARKVFHISDDEGNSKDFVIKSENKTAIYTTDDITAILDAALLVTEEALKRGEEVSIHGFGNLGLIYRKPRELKVVGTSDKVLVEGHYIPKFTFGSELRLCAKLYELSLDENSSDKNSDE